MEVLGGNIWPACSGRLWALLTQDFILFNNDWTNSSTHELRHRNCSRHDFQRFFFTINGTINRELGFMGILSQKRSGFVKKIFQRPPNLHLLLSFSFIRHMINCLLEPRFHYTVRPATWLMEHETTRSASLSASAVYITNTQQQRSKFRLRSQVITGEPAPNIFVCYDGTWISIMERIGMDTNNII
jgi:hypothetical protein